MIKCYEKECEFYKPIYKLRSKRTNTREKHSGGHCKDGKRTNYEVSGRCILGMKNRVLKCKKVLGLLEKKPKYSRGGGK